MPDDRHDDDIDDFPDDSPDADDERADTPAPGRYLVLYVFQARVVSRKVYEQASHKEEGSWVAILQGGREIARFREDTVQSWEYTDDAPQS